MLCLIFSALKLCFTMCFRSVLQSIARCCRQNACNVATAALPSVICLSWLLLSPFLLGWLQVLSCCRWLLLGWMQQHGSCGCCFLFDLFQISRASIQQLSDLDLLYEEARIFCLIHALLGINSNSNPCFLWVCMRSWPLAHAAFCGFAALWVERPSTGLLKFASFLGAVFRAPRKAT